MRHGQGCGRQGLLPGGLLGLQGGVGVSGRLGGLGREAEGLRGARVRQQGPGLQAVGAGWALAGQGGLGVRRGGRLASGHGQRLQRGVRGGQPLWVQSRCLLDVGMGSGTRRSLAGGLGG